MPIERISSYSCSLSLIDSLDQEIVPINVNTMHPQLLPPKHTFQKRLNERYHHLLKTPTQHNE